jgi:hypothetical protein
MKKIWIILLFALPALLSFAQRPREIVLKSGKVTITSTSTMQAQSQKSVNNNQYINVLIESDSTLTPDIKTDLSRKNIWIDQMITPGVYFARIKRTSNMKASLVQNYLGNYFFLGPKNKVETDVWNRDYDNYLANPPGDSARNYVWNGNGTVNLVVSFYTNSSVAGIRDFLQGLTIKFTSIDEHNYNITLNEDKLQTLASSDKVRWISAGSPPPIPDNDRTRVVIHAEELQQFNPATGVVTGLGGHGVTIGIFDSGIDEEHPDFALRIKGDPSIDEHGTHVAGIVAGSGSHSDRMNSNGVHNGGTPFAWRGMAPHASLIDIDYSNGDSKTEIEKYVRTQGMDLSNHSYVVSLNGVYSASTGMRDQVIRGTVTPFFSRIPGRLQIYSAGNNGVTNEGGGAQIGYFSLTKQMKNALVIGNYNPANRQLNDNGQLNETSSLGPTHDGRIKPDLVAPGTNVRSTIFTGSMRNGYSVKNGTSMAAPAVSGAIALLLQQYRLTYGIDFNVNPLLPSTLRALLINSAIDIIDTPPFRINKEGNELKALEGPDFTTGFGLIQAGDAARLVRERKIIEGDISECETNSFTFFVHGANPPKVAVTLAWDDLEGSSAGLDTAPKLQNDLDVELTDPHGNIHYPWKLDQKITDLNGVELTDAQQKCGSIVLVQRSILPIVRPSVIPLIQEHLTIPSAVRGKDHLNNVEKIEAPALPGFWTVKITGFKVTGNQPYSLIGIRPMQTTVMAVCNRFPSSELCKKQKKKCEEQPEFCKQQITYPSDSIFTLNFKNSRDEFMIVLDDICLLNEGQNCLPCPSENCNGYNLTFADPESSLEIEIVNSNGEELATDKSGAPVKLLTVNQHSNQGNILLIRPSKDTPTQKSIQLKYKIQLTEN